MQDGALTWTVVTDAGAVIEAAEEYLEYARQRGLRANTVRSYAQGLAQWWSFLEETGTGWDRVSVADVVAFLGWLRSPGRPGGALAAGSVQARLRPVTNCYRYHATRGTPILAGVPHDAPERPRQYSPFLGHIRHAGWEGPAFSIRRRRGPTPVLTPVQIRALLDAEAAPLAGGDWSGDLRYRFLWSLLAETGMRIGEALGLQHRDWGDGRGGSTVVTVADRPGPYGLAAKSGLRRIHVGSRLDALYADWVWWLCDRGADQAVADWDSGYVFCALRGPGRFGPLRPENVYQHLAAVKRRTPTVPAAMTPHWFRHTHATALLLSGAPAHVVARRLGHRDVQTTLNTYGHVTEDAELHALANWSALTETWDALHD